MGEIDMSSTNICKYIRNITNICIDVVNSFLGQNLPQIKSNQFARLNLPLKD